MLYIAARDFILFLHIREGKSDSWFTVSDSDFKVNAEIFFRSCKELDVKLNGGLNTYLPTKLQALTSPEGSGMATALLDRIEPLILKALRAMVGS